MSDLLLRVSRIIGLDLSYLFKNGFWVALRYGVVAFFGLLLTIGFAQFASKELFGQYQFVLSLVALFSVLSLPGFNIAALKSIASGGDRTAIQQAVRWSFLSSLLVLPILGGYVTYRYFFQEDISIELATALVVGTLFFPFFYASNTWYVAYEGRVLFKSVAIRATLSSAIVTIALLSGLFLHAGLITLISIYFGLTALISWFFYFETISDKKKEELFKGSDSGDLDVRYGFSVTAQKFVFGLSESVPPLVLVYFLGLEFLAVFQIAYYFMNAVSGVLTALSALYLPKLFNGTNLMYGRIVWQALIAGLLSFFLLAILLKTVFMFFYGESYLESYQLAWYLAPLLVFYPLRTYLVNFFTAQGRNGLIVFSYIVANFLGVTVFLCMKNADPFLASASYIYTLAAVTLLSLFPAYFFTASKKTDSI